LAGEKAKGKRMQGIVVEGEQQIERKNSDLGLIGAGERVEHYEMASHQVAIAVAKQLGLDKAEKLLTESLREEENAAKLLSQLSKRVLKDLSRGTTAAALE
jgi:ferritin-like metal-binding protein YciE